MLKKGDAVIWEGKLARYEGALELNRAHIYVLEDSCYISVSPGNLTIASITSAPSTDRQLWMAEDPKLEALREIAKHRYEVITLHYNPNISVASQLTTLMDQLNLSSKQCYRLIALFDADIGPSSLLMAKRGRKKHVPQIDARVEEIIHSSIKSDYTGVGAAVKKVHEKVELRCNNGGCAVPSLQTVRRRIAAENQRELTNATLGKKNSNDIYEPRFGEFKTGSPLEMWQMDHTVMDCFIVDELYRKPLCRPWVTLIIDKHTRVVMGFYLSIKGPSSHSVCMALSHAVLPKDDWLHRIGIEAIDYPYYGKPKLINIDNAREFHAQGFERAADFYNIKLGWRPYGKPWWGGHIERLNRTLQMGYVNFLPGATLNSVKLRKNIDPEDTACLTLSEATRWFAVAIEQYHNTPHRILGCTPRQKWIESMTDEQGVLHHPDLIEDASAFKINFLPSIPGGRVVSRQGIEFEGILYSDVQLNHHVNPSKKIDVKYDPTSMRYIWARPTGDKFLKIPWRDIFRPDISYDEWKYARSQCGPIQNSQDIDRRFACILKGRNIVEEGLEKTRAARKRFEHAAHARSNAPHANIETFDPATNSYSGDTSRRKPRLLDTED